MTANNYIVYQSLDHEEVRSARMVECPVSSFRYPTDQFISDVKCTVRVVIWPRVRPHSAKTPLPQ